MVQLPGDLDEKSEDGAGGLGHTYLGAELGSIGPLCPSTAKQMAGQELVGA